MITEEQARAAWREHRKRSRGSLIVPPEVVDMLDQWADDEETDPPDDDQLTPEEADQAYDEAEAVPISRERIAEIVQYVRDRSDGPITAEWCLENGAKRAHDVVRGDVRLWSAYWHLAGVVVTVDGGVRFVVNGHEVLRQLTRSELLAIVTALRGEPSGQTGQLQPLSPAEQLPHGGSRE